jgi:hypothetical protein
MTVSPGKFAKLFAAERARALIKPAMYRAACPTVVLPDLLLSTLGLTNHSNTTVISSHARKPVWSFQTY